MLDRAPYRTRFAVFMLKKEQVFITIWNPEDCWKYTMMFFNLRYQMEEGKDFALTVEKAEVPQYIEVGFTGTPD